MGNKKELSTVQKLNRLPVGTYIKFNKYHDGQDRTWFAQKQESVVFSNEKPEAVWKDMMHDRIEFKKNQIPSNFEVVSEKEVEIAKLERGLEVAKEFIEGAEWEAMKVEAEQKITGLKKELAAEKINKKPSFEEKVNEAKAIKAQLNSEPKDRQTHNDKER